MLILHRQDIFSDCLLESSDIRLEEASIMYNIAALHSILGVKERRADADVSFFLLLDFLVSYGVSRDLKIW